MEAEEVTDLTVKFQGFFFLVQDFKEITQNFFRIFFFPGKIMSAIIQLTFV